VACEPTVGELPTAPSGETKMKKLKIILILVACVMCVMFVLSLQSAAPQKTTGTIEMVQPCGWWWCADHDQQYAEHVNRPNSEANRNNSEARINNAEAESIEKSTAINQSSDRSLGFCMGVGFIVFMVGGTALLSYRGKNG
jgi:uncharacterized protein YfaP (DUF2135 family)